MSRDEGLRCVVVGGVDYGEADRIVRVLSAEEGRGAVMARRARASRKRFAGLLDIGCELELQRRRGKGSLPLLVGAELVAAPRHARADLDRIALLAYGCELCAALAPEGHEVPKLFRLLQTWLALLEADGTAGDASRIALEAKALTFAGMTPALLTCARCGLRLDDPAVFERDEGGGHHAHCRHGTPVPVAVLDRLELLRRTPLAQTLDQAGAPPDFRWLLSDFARHHLGRDLRSRGLLESL